MAYADIDAGKVLNKEGLLELSNQIKSYVDANAGGGSSYTAGDGINIDSNGVISKKTGAVPLFTLLRLIFNGGNAQNQRQADQQATQGYTNDSSTLLGSSSIDLHLANLNAYGMTYIKSCMSDTIANIVSGVGDDATAQFKFMKGNYNTSNRTLEITSISATNASNYNNVGSYVSNQPTLVIFDKTKPYGSYYRWYIIAQPERSFENLPFYSQKGLISTNMSGAIDELATRIPSAPTTDGTYKLISTVASGTPTYSWGTDSGGSGGGTTYTAGTGISIENGVISLNLANAEEGTY